MLGRRTAGQMSDLLSWGSTKLFYQPAFVFPFWIPKSFKERALTDSTSLLPGGCSPLPLATGGVQKILSKPLTAQRQVRDVLFTGKVLRDNKHILHSCPMTSSRLAQCIAGSELRNGSRVPLLFPKRSFPPHTEERMRFPVTPSLRRRHRKEDMQFREQAKTISCWLRSLKVVAVNEGWDQDYSLRTTFGDLPQVRHWAECSSDIASWCLHGNLLQIYLSKITQLES